MTTEPADIRLKRLQMRSMRRGIKEMDIILGGFAQRGLTALPPAQIDLYEDLLEENDHDLYQWVSGQVKAPTRYDDLMRHIAAVQKDRKT